MNTKLRTQWCAAFLLCLAAVQPAFGQATTATASEHLAEILGLRSQIKNLRALQSQRLRGSTATLEEVFARQEFLELLQASILDVDGVLAELSNERNELGDLRTSLQNRRDTSVGRLNAAALIAGSGVGAVVSATQFTSFGTRAQNAGDGIGIGSAIASTVLSLVAVRRQRGPTATVENVPNMLAPLLGGSPILHTRYPPAVLQYLQSVPAGEDPSLGTRLQQLKETWYRTGRLSEADPLNRGANAPLVTSNNPQQKVLLSDLDNRIAMLGDVSGRVALMKRDLAVLVRSFISAQ